MWVLETTMIKLRIVDKNYALMEEDRVENGQGGSRAALGVSSGNYDVRIMWKIKNRLKLRLLRWRSVSAHGSGSMRFKSRITSRIT